MSLTPVVARGCGDGDMGSGAAVDGPPAIKKGIESSLWALASLLDKTTNNPEVRQVEIRADQRVARWIPPPTMESSGMQAHFAQV